MTPAPMPPQEIADRLLAARRGGPKLAPGATGGRPASSEESYRVQALVAAALGPVGGFKTARKPGVPQIMAPILAADVRTSPAVFGPSELDLIGIELEVGFVVERPLPEPEHPEFAALAREAVSAVATLEIVDARIAAHETADPLLKLADNQINGGLVVGTPRRDWQGLDLSRVAARLDLGGETVLDGPAEVPGGDAFETFCALARMVGAHCGGLKPGQVVITGSLNGLPFVERGTPVWGRIEGLGEVRADFPA